MLLCLEDNQRRGSFRPKVGLVNYFEYPPNVRVSLNNFCVDNVYKTQFSLNNLIAITLNLLTLAFLVFICFYNYHCIMNCKYYLTNYKTITDRA